MPAKARVKKVFLRSIRPAGDTAWWDLLATPLLVFLSEWRAWEDLMRWSKKEKLKEAVLTNVLAYLYIGNKARYHPATKLWGPMVGDLPTAETVECLKKSRKPKSDQSSPPSDAPTADSTTESLPQSIDTNSTSAISVPTSSVSEEPSAVPRSTRRSGARPQPLHTRPRLPLRAWR